MVDPMVYSRRGAEARRNRIPTCIPYACCGFCWRGSSRRQRGCGELQDALHLRSFDSGKPFQKLRDRRSALKVLEQGSNGDTASTEFPSAPADLRDPFDPGTLRPLCHEGTMSGHPMESRVLGVRWRDRRGGRARWSSRWGDRRGRHQGQPWLDSAESEPSGNAHVSGAGDQGPSPRMEATRSPRLASKVDWKADSPASSTVA